jgi:agmatinase/guanidinopropionase
LSFDLDALDSCTNASSSAVEPFGLDHIWTYDVLKHLRLSNRIDLVGADVVEYAPYMDPTLKDGYLAAAYAWFLLRWLATEVSRRAGEKRLTEWPQGFGAVSL